MATTEKNANAFDMTSLTTVNSGYSLMLINNSTNEGQLIRMTDLANMINNEDQIPDDITDRIDSLENRIAGITGGVPTVVSSTSEMTDTDKIYILSTDSKWYYHNGSTWVVGGVYGGVPTDKTLTQSDKAADAKAVGDTINGVKEDLNSLYSEIDLNNCAVSTGYINTTYNTIYKSSTRPARLLIIPIKDLAMLKISIPTYSVKRYGFMNWYFGHSISIYSDSSSSTAPLKIYDVHEVDGALDIVCANANGYRYMVIQLFANADSQQDYNVYLANASAYGIKKWVDNEFFYTENLNGLPILSSFGDITIDTNAYANSALFHEYVKTNLVDVSNGYVTRTLLGEDNYGNSLYKYETFPETIYYDVSRSATMPIVPVTEGQTVKPYTVIITSNIHGVEHNGNWAVFNLIKKALNGDSDMLRFFRNRVKIIWIPYICMTGDYENSDGININRDFPLTKTGTCVSPEATMVKGVIDDYGDAADLHLDIHTFYATGTYGPHLASFVFTNDKKLAVRGVITAKDVVERYYKANPTIERLSKEVVNSVNIATTCTSYTDAVYGIPAGTVEGVDVMDGSPSGTDNHTSATAYLYDIVSQIICNMAKK